ncbi:unnamed protein product [Hyaloperonospora brassicae]|uniref:Uncharacterized protein n=1 Tax=Hyaloperonospora brassicae TaxID=162125 RepID=A0AAV0TNJ0_HYABA|nr:unnamed protein product [Hyaloperonospora brassicae]
MATIYSGLPAHMRFPFGSAHTHYTSNDDAAAQIQMQMQMQQQQMRYSPYVSEPSAVEGVVLRRPLSLSSAASTGAPLLSTASGTFGRAMKPPAHPLGPLYPSPESASHVFRPASPRFRSHSVAACAYTPPSRMHETYASPPPLPQHQQPLLLYASSRLGDRLQQQQQPSLDVLLVSPGVPTPVELSIYEIKQPTGFLHVTRGNQTVEFLDGVANMPPPKQR